MAARPIEDKLSDELKPYQIPYVHRKIKLEDLKDNNKLLDDTEINKVKELTKDMKDGYLDLAQFSLEGRNIQLLKSGEKYYAVYGARNDSQSALGAGAFGEVRLMQDLNNGEWIALKTQKKPKKPKEPEQKKPKKEDPYDQQVQQENKALADMEQLKFQTTLIENGETYYLSALSLAKGVELFSGVVEPQRKLPTVRRLDMSLSMLRHLKEMHEKFLLHCDIKPHNMIFDPASHEVKLVDYGLSSRMDEKTREAKDSYKGTSMYMAPELLVAKQRHQLCVYDEKTEVYAIGMSMMEMFGFAECNRGTWFFDDTSSTIADPMMREKVFKILEKMISTSPGDRPCLSNVIEEMEKIRNLQLRAPDLLNRVAIVDIQEHKDLLTNLLLLSEKLAEKKAEIACLENEIQSCGKIINKYHQALFVDELSEELKRAFATAQDTLKTSQAQLKSAKTDLADIEKQIRAIKGIDLLQKSDEIWLAAPQGTKPDDFIKAKRALENIGIIVNGEALNYGSKSVSTVVQAYAEKREDKDKNIYLCAEFTKARELVFPEKVSKRHLDKVIQTLQEDADRLFQKGKTVAPGDAIRANEIRKCVAELRHLASDGKLTYAMLDKHLVDLQKKLYSNNGFIAMYEKAFDINISTARKKVHGLLRDSKQIQEVCISPKKR